MELAGIKIIEEKLGLDPMQKGMFWFLTAVKDYELQQIASVSDINGAETISITCTNTDGIFTTASDILDSVLKDGKGKLPVPKGNKFVSLRFGDCQDIRIVYESLVQEKISGTDEQRWHALDLLVEDGGGRLQAILPKMKELMSQVLYPVRLVDRSGTSYLINSYYAKKAKKHNVELHPSPLVLEPKNGAAIIRSMQAFVRHLDFLTPEQVDVLLNPKTPTDDKLRFISSLNTPSLIQALVDVGRWIDTSKQSSNAGLQRYLYSLGCFPRTDRRDKHTMQYRPIGRVSGSQLIDAALTLYTQKKRRKLAIAGALLGVPAAIGVGMAAQNALRHKDPPAVVRTLTPTETGTARPTVRPTTPEPTETMTPTPDPVKTQESEVAEMFRVKYDAYKNLAGKYGLHGEDINIAGIIRPETATDTYSPDFQYEAFILALTQENGYIDNNSITLDEDGTYSYHYDGQTLMITLTREDGDIVVEVIEQNSEGRQIDTGRNVPIRYKYSPSLNLCTAYNKYNEEVYTYSRNDRRCVALGGGFVSNALISFDESNGIPEIAVMKVR